MQHNRNYDAIAVLRDNGAASLVERVRYTPYGVARHEPASDMDGDGSVSGAELLAILPLLGMGFSSPNYNPDLDADRDGQINTSDYLAVLANFAAGVAEGKVSTVHNIIAYSGYVYDEAVDLNLARNRWLDAGLGRWLSRDALHYTDSHNLYLYVQATPLLSLDAQGLSSLVHPATWVELFLEPLFAEGLSTGQIVTILITVNVSAGIIATELGLSVAHVQNKEDQWSKGMSSRAKQLLEQYKSRVKTHNSKNPCDFWNDVLRQASKSIKSMQKNIAEHQKYISDPRNILKKPGTKSAPYNYICYWQAKWQKDIRRAERDISHNKEVVTRVNQLIRRYCK